jgi:phosphatidylglycerol---prolipoprotein diacylglyceryl transferase
MFPTLVRIGSFEITTFGLMMFIAFIAAGWVATRQYRRYGLSEELASSMLMACAIGGIVGAKVYYAILFRDWHLLFDRAGLVWYGGLIGGTLACTLLLQHRRVDWFTAADATAPAVAIGYCLGRIGCFLVGDDYGRPTNSWIGIAFPKGSPPTTAEALRQFGVRVDPSVPPDQILRVHPTQIYESAAALVIFFILLAASRRPHPKGRVFGLFLVLLGIERFLVEIVRAKDDRFLGPFTIAQLISVIALIVGVALTVRRSQEVPQPV